MPSRRTSILIGVIVAVSFSWADYMEAQRSDSIFYMDGLAVDRLAGTEAERASYEEIDMPIFELKPIPRRAPPLPPPALVRPPERGGTTIPATQVQVHMERGAEYFQASRWQDALSEFLQADSLAPNNPAIMERVAVAAALTRNYDTAEIYFTRYLEANPDRITHLTGLAGVLVRQGDYRRARDILDRVIASEPDHISAHLNLLLIEYATGGHITSAFDWSHLSLRDTISVAQWLRGDRAELESLVSADVYRALVERALGRGAYGHLDIIPDQLFAYVDATQNNHRDEARRVLLRILDYGVRNRGTLSEMAHLHLLAGEYRESMDIMAVLAERYPDTPRISYNYGLTLVKNERYAEAIDAFEREMAVDPDYPDARFALACAFAGLGRMDEAWPVLQKLAADYPGRMAEWVEGDDAYLVAIRSDPRYEDLRRRFR